MSEMRTIVKSLRMQNFGCYRDKTIEFSSGLNQIAGPNESGKSTILRALYTVLFEDGSTRKKSVESLQNWVINQPFKLTLIFTVGDRQFTLIRDYGTGKDLMTDSDGIVYEGKAVNEKLSRYFGTSDRTLYESIFSVSSDEPDAPESSRSRLQSAIETPILYGFDRGGADRYLDEEIKKLDNPRAHGPRELDRIGDEITAALQKKTELEENLGKLDKDKRELNEVRERTADHEKRIEFLEKEVDGAEAYSRLDSRMANLEERLQTHLSNYSRASQVADDLQKINKELESSHVPEPEAMDAIRQKNDEIKTSVEESKRRMDDLTSRKKKAIRSVWGATILLALICVAYVVHEQGFIRSETISDLLPYTVPAMILVWASRLSVYLIQISKRKRATAIFRNQVMRIDKFYAEVNAEYNLKAADPVKSLEESIQWHRALEMSAQNLQETIDTLSEGKGLGELNKIKAQLEIEVAQLNKELAPLTGFAASAAKLPDLKEELVAKRVRVNAMRERAALLSERCSALDSIETQIKEIDNEVEALKRKHRDITEKLEILKVTRLALNRAADQLIEDTFTEYSEDASANLSALTDGKYDGLRFMKDPCHFEIKIRETGKWIELSKALSSSTRDCAYLALRFAAITRLGADFMPPIILDQADTRMDTDRRGRLFHLIREMGQNQQVIYLTPNRFDELGEAVEIKAPEIAAAEPQPDTA